MESTIKYYGLKDVLSFGKYRGQQVCDVIDLDINYITWCLDNIPTFKLSKDAEEAYNKFSSWTIISSSDFVMPVDGVYLVACRGDNHIEYEIHKYQRGQRFWEFFEGENAHLNGWFCVEPMGYYRLPLLKYWKVNKKPQGPDFYVVAILDNNDVVKEYGYAFNWNKFDSNEIVGRGLKYKLLPHEAFGDQRMFEWMDGWKKA